MADLIEKYFQEDLTEEERKTLGGQLSSSEEAAKRFGEVAGEAYRQTGLPEPQWTGPDSLRPGKSDWGMWIELAILLAAILSVTGFLVFYGREGSKPSVAAPSLGGTPIVPPVQKSMPPAKPAPANQAITVPQPAPALPPKGETPAPLGVVSGAAPGLPALPAPAPRFTPVNLDQNPHRPFSSLSVKLHLAGPRAMVVRVLDEKGNVLVPLFNGQLQPGTWVFEWNGRLQNGQLAGPGLYRIEVRAGSWVQAKDVRIQP